MASGWQGHCATSNTTQAPERAGRCRPWTTPALSCLTAALLASAADHQDRECLRALTASLPDAGPHTAAASGTASAESTAPDGEAKVSGPDGAVGALIEEQKVVWLDVAVDDAFGMTLSNESAPPEHNVNLLCRRKQQQVTSQTGNAASAMGWYLGSWMRHCTQACRESNICNWQAGSSRAHGPGRLLTV